MEPRAIVKRSEVAGRPATPRVKFARPISHKPKPGSVYDPELGVGVRMTPFTTAEKFLRLGRAIKLHMEGIVRAAKEPSPTRVVNVDVDDLFAEPVVNLEKRAQL